MITQILIKQLDRELERIYARLPEFVDEFIGEEALEHLDDDNYFFAFSNSFIYIQRHWVEEQDGEDVSCVEEGHVDYEDYNRWVNLKNVH